MAATVAVVGGGIIGSSIAWRLAQKGARVTIFEAGALGGEASWAGAGMLSPGGEVDAVDGWGGLAIESARLYPEFVRELSAESGVAIDYRLRGALEVARGESEAAELEARAARQAPLGIASEALTIAAARDLVPRASLDAFASARFYPGDGQVDPRHVMAALRKALTARGAAIRENTAARRITASATHARVDGETFDAAVIAAGAWTAHLEFSASEPASYPVRGHLTGYRLEPGFLGPILRHHHTYLLQRSNGFLIAGTSSEDVGFVRDIDPSIAADIRRRAVELLPGLPARGPDEVWTGFRPGIRQDGPRIGRHGDSAVWLAYGHYRNGILLAPATSRDVAAAIAASLVLTASSGTD